MNPTSVTHEPRKTRMIHACEYLAREVTLEEWEHLLEQFPDFSVFHTLPWFQMIEAVHGASVRMARADDEDGRCVAIWPVFETRKGPLKILGSPVPGWCTAYMGPLFGQGCDVDAALRAFLQHKLFQRGSYFSCKVLNDKAAVDLSPFGFDEVEKLDTYCLDLTLSQDELWSNLKSECRTRVRKAEKLGLEVRQESDDSFLDTYWEMSRETFAICSIKPPFTQRFLEEMWRTLHPAGLLRAVSAWHNGERIATLMLPFDRRTMYYWGGASYIRHRGIPAHNLLHWEAIKLAQDLGLHRYDFVSTSGGGGRFKKTFGPRVLHVATHWERTSSRLIRALKTGYQQLLMRRQQLKA
jgi:hypothetical protein